MDPYFKKEISYKFKDAGFVFDVGNTLFSSFDLDHGTDILLRNMELELPKTILDIGCGYGPIGIVLAKEFPDAEVTMVDKDLLAVRYAKSNAEKNGIKNIQVFGSIAMEKVLDKKFDVIVSNLPAKIGDEAIEKDFIVTPIEHLNDGGSLWLVVVSGLNRLIPKLARLHEYKIIEVKKRSGHTVYKITK
jgi:16S rRNA (guanine1207-N2)-methyltransferase